MRYEIDKIVLFCFLIQEHLEWNVSESSHLIYFENNAIDMFDHFVIDLGRIESSKANIFRIALFAAAKQSKYPIYLNSAKYRNSDMVLKDILNISLFPFEEGDELISTHKWLMW